MHADTFALRGAALQQKKCDIKRIFEQRLQSFHKVLDLLFTHSDMYFGLMG